MHISNMRTVPQAPLDIFSPLGKSTGSVRSEIGLRSLRLLVSHASRRLLPGFVADCPSSVNTYPFNGGDSSRLLSVGSSGFLLSSNQTAHLESNHLSAQRRRLTKSVWQFTCSNNEGSSLSCSCLCMLNICECPPPHRAIWLTTVQLTQTSSSPVSTNEMRTAVQTSRTTPTFGSARQGSTLGVVGEPSGAQS